MADNEQLPAALVPVAKPLSLIPVGLKEAALDSPTFRATAFHFGEQIDVIEKWLENYVKAASRLANEVTSLESLINTYLSWATPPQQVSEAVLDHDYTMLALKRYNEGAREFWSATVKWMKKVESTVVDPIKAFILTDVANLKNARRNLDQTQRNFDSLMSRYSSQSKTKEASSLREDAFQLHEARKAYLKSSMDFCVLAPQVRTSLDKLLVKIFSDRWRDMKNSRDALATSFGKWSGDMDRIRGWSKEMENSERIFKRELQMARKQIEDSAELTIRPSRELDDYSVSTVPYIGSSAGNSRPPNKEAEEKAEKQGWLFQRTITGKPARTVWLRRWFYVNHGIFGWLSNSNRTGAVEESEKTGVLLCGVRPNFQEERRFCFEVKTKDTTIVLQAETQSELMEWISTFEVAKRKALENPASTEAIAAGSKSFDAAFAISPPVAPEFAAKTSDGPQAHEDGQSERSATLGVDPSPLATRSSIDVTSKRPVAGEREAESNRDHAARIIQKLDLVRKSNVGPQMAGTQSPGTGGGIASLISASHNVLPLGGAGVAQPLSISTDFKTILGNQLPTSSFAPSTLAHPPAPTNLSKTAVIVSGERGLKLGTAATDGSMPGGLMANIWGTANWGYLNRLERGDVKPAIERRRSVSQPPSPVNILPPMESTSGGDRMGAPELSPSPGITLVPSIHRKTYSMTPHTAHSQARSLVTSEDFPNYYPLSLKAQDAQFRMLFPDVKRESKLVLVFRAMWAANEQQEFPGRVYVTMHDIYFYSHHLGLVLISSLHLDAIAEVTAAPGKDCDFLFVHLKPGVSRDGTTRVTIKTFLEPLKLLQRRLNFLVRNAEAEESDTLEEVMKSLTKMEASGADESPSMESWEDVSVNTPTDGALRRDNDVRAGLRIDGTLYPDPSQRVSRNATKFRLPGQPVIYAPQGMAAPVVERGFDVTAKALFHVLAGDKSTVFQMLNFENGAERLVQTPWVQPEQGLHRREFRYQINHGRRKSNVCDHQIIDVLNDHLCYVITDRRTPWALPSAHSFSLVSKIVITHVAKSRCKLAIYNKVDWGKPPLFGKRLIESQALSDLEIYASSLAAILVDQVSRLGTQANSNSRKAVQIFGQIGQQTQAAHITAAELPPSSMIEQRISSHSLASLAFRVANEAVSQALFAALGFIFQVLESFVRVATAYRLLVLLLMLSSFANFYFANHETWSWWRERQALSLMAKVGVRPNTAIGRSVWLKDLNEWMRSPESNQTGFGALNNPCASQFNTLLSQTDPSAPVDSHPTDLSFSRPTHSTVKRMQRSRLHIGSYRHDLMVALRMVDRVEQEMLRVEWESWLWSESRRCRQAKEILDIRSSNDTIRLRSWWDEYCISCLHEIGKQAT